MTVSVTQKLRAVECLGNNSWGYLVKYYNFGTKNTIKLIKIIIESSYDYVET